MRFAVHHRPGSPFSGGGHTYIDTLIHELAERVGATRHTMVLFAIGATPPAEFRGKSVELHRIPALSGTALAFVLSAALRRWRWHPFAGLQRTVDFYLQTRLAARLEGLGVQFLWSPQPYVHTMELPYAITIWDLQQRKQGFFPEVSNRGTWQMREQACAEMICRSVYAISSNETGKAEIERYYQMPSSRVISLPHFPPRWVLSPPPDDPGDLPRQYGLAQGNFILYPAQFWPHKNHVRIVEALALLRPDQSKPLQLVLVGSDYGNLEHIKRCVAEHGLIDRVCFPGFVSNGQLAWLYRHAHSLVYASMFGPENLPPLEALALGCPVICARYDGAVDQLGDGALYFAPDNAAELAERLRELDAAAVRERLVRTGAEITRRWTPQKYVENIFSLLERFEATRRCWP